MKLWLLRPRDDLPKPASTRVRVAGNPWEPWYDKAFGYVVRAETESRARELAAAGGGSDLAHAWRTDELSTCVELTPDGEEEVIMQDFAAA